MLLIIEIDHENISDGHVLNGKTGPDHIRWKGGKLLSRKYYKIWKPEHPHCDNKGYVPEHRLVYEEFYDCCLLPYPIVDVHHINGIKSDNNITNLQPIFHSKHAFISNIKDLSNRICLLCGTKKTTRNKRGSFNWFKHNDGFVCHSCYSKIKYKEKFKRD